MLPIEDAEGKMTGILTKTNAYRAMTHGQDFGKSVTVSTIPNHGVAALHEEQTVREALRVLDMKDVKQAPVLDHESRPVGILSDMNVAEARIRLEHRTSDRVHGSSNMPLPQSQE
ncbi:MAG: hypothetical protein NPIRA06_16150 [Nitrospirales bacterium]|nr:MAG: hypothetical protein NPIRA06_16150 [Nitrospirales bacterium]